MRVLAVERQDDARRAGDGGAMVAGQRPRQAAGVEEGERDEEERKEEAGM